MLEIFSLLSPRREKWHHEHVPLTLGRDVKTPLSLVSGICETLHFDTGRTLIFLEILYTQNFLARAFGARAFLVSKGRRCAREVFTRACIIFAGFEIISVCFHCLWNLESGWVQKILSRYANWKKLSHFDFWRKCAQKAVAHVFHALKGSENMASFCTWRKTALGRMQKLLLQMHLKSKTVSFAPLAFAFTLCRTVVERECAVLDDC